ncbi:hypothetical protein GX50_07691 [[Emmonsia] crescens]|uniref:Uncharacterized protein n=1 Tax=[Emmonsia] crescens TaxID=73230 RepID=A0A2B7Z8K1_9EURO|nr:hypothetical protein GX50_07691 [Emmonsia crescens]
MGKRITREIREQRAREAGFNPDKSNLSEKQVLKSLEPSVERGYDDMWEIWEESHSLLNTAPFTAGTAFRGDCRDFDGPTETEDKWHASAVKNLCHEVDDKWVAWLFSWFIREFWWGWHVYKRFILLRLFGCSDSSLQSGLSNCGKWINQEHSAMIRGLIPSERLLE